MALYKDYTIMNWDKELLQAKSAYETSIEHMEEAKQNKSNKEESLLKINDGLFHFFERIFTKQGYSVKRHANQYSFNANRGMYISFNKVIEIFLNKEFIEKYSCLRRITINYDMCVTFYPSKSEELNTLRNIVWSDCDDLHIYQSEISRKFSTPSEVLEKFADMEIISNGKNLKGNKA